MKRFSLCLVAAIFAASAVGAQETIADRLSKLEDNHAAIQAQLNGISAMQSRLQSDVTDVRHEIELLRDKLDALVKVATPRAAFKPSTLDAWGRGSPATFSGAASAAATADSASGPVTTFPTSAVMTSMPSFSYGMSGGNCAGGSCGVGGMGSRSMFGGGGLFGRRR